MNFTDINEMLVVNPSEKIEDITQRYSLALQYAIEIIKDHMDLSVNTQVSYDESDVSPVIYVDADYDFVIKDETDSVEVRIENMVNKEAVLQRLNNLAISPTEITIFSTMILLCFDLIKPIVVNDEDEKQLVSDTFASILFDLELNLLADFCIIRYDC